MSETIYEIEVDYPETADHTLRFSLGACKFTAEPGSERWLEGEYIHPESDVLPIKVTQKGGTVHVSQEVAMKGVKLHNLGNLFKRAPRMHMSLGTAKPYNMIIEAGAYDGTYDLGGIPLTGLAIKQGAGKVVFDFAEPNPAEMDQISVDAGAMALTMRNLANANFGQMVLNGGASKYLLDFSGGLQRDARVKITAGVASVSIQIPATTAAKVYSETTLGKFSVNGFTQQDGAYLTPAAINGKTPLLTIEADVSMGTLNIETI